MYSRLGMQHHETVSDSMMFVPSAGRQSDVLELLLL